MITIIVTAEDTVDKNTYKITVTRNPPIASTVTAVDASAGYNSADQNLTLSAVVTGTSGTVNDGTVTFQLNDGVNNVGSPVQSGPVTNGSVSVTYSLPGGSPAQIYSILAFYANSNMYDVSSDSSHRLVVQPSVSTIAATSAQAAFNSAGKDVVLDATVTSPSGAVNQGTVTFQVLDSGNKPVGIAVKSPTVANGAAEVTYNLPAGTATGTYTLSAIYSGTTNIVASTDNTHTVSVAVDMPPTITDFETNDNPALLNAPVTYQFAATDPDSAMLSYTFDFGDGSRALTGTFPQGTSVSVAHTYTAYTVGAPITLTVTDGNNPVTATDTLVVPMPNSGASNVPNTVQGQPPIVTPTTTPLGGLSVQVQSSNGGVIQLGIDISSLTRDAYEVSTDWGDISGRYRKVPGTNPVHVYNNRGIFVAKTTATNKSTNAVSGKARITLPLSSKETGDITGTMTNDIPGVRTHATTTPDHDQVTERQVQLQRYQDRYGNVLRQHSNSRRNHHRAAARILDRDRQHHRHDDAGSEWQRFAPRIAWHPEESESDQQTKEGSDERRRRTGDCHLYLQHVAMVTNGFDTEGISTASTDLPKGKSASRIIQVAMLLDGAPFQSLAPVNFSKSANSDLGTISGRSAKP